MPEKREKPAKAEPEEKEAVQPEKANPQPKELDRTELETLRRNLQSKFHR